MYARKLRIAVAVALLIIRKRRRRRWWIRPALQRRNDFGEYVGLIPHLRDRDTEIYFKYMRMTPAQFDCLHSKVRHRLTRTSARRPTVPSDEKLMITLCYLASGCQQVDLSLRFGRGRSTISGIVYDTSIAIYEELAPIHLKFPETQEEWLNISKGFWEKWQFPNCLGAIDGKHFTIQCPKRSGSLYYNYKHRFSTLVLAICDSEYKFTYLEVGSYGREGDAGVFARSGLFDGLEHQRFNIPESRLVKDTNFSSPFVLLGDEAFPMKSYLMRPFPGRGGRVPLDYVTRVYNYRHSRARRTVENAFGILSARWRLFLRPVIAETSHVEAFIRAAFVLHNYLRTEDLRATVGEDPVRYAPASMYDREEASGNLINGLWRRETETSGIVPARQLGGNRSSDRVRQQQMALANFFVSPQGAVSWQASMVSLFNNE